LNNVNRTRVIITRWYSSNKQMRYLEPSGGQLLIATV